VSICFSWKKQYPSGQFSFDIHYATTARLYFPFIVSTRAAGKFATAVGK
jgi:hypothetical protein